MIKKIIISSAIIVTVLIIIGLTFSASSTEDLVKVPELVIEADVIMPTKVSRPGCDETDRCYIPSLIVINSGNDVTWVNEDSAFHSVTSGFYGEPDGLFDSGYLDPFESYTITFDEKGTYDYFCVLHPWMKAQVIVE